MLSKLTLLPDISVANNESEAIGRRVKSSRMLAGLSRKDLNDKYGISAATLRSWEDPKGGRKGLTEKGALRLIKALADAGVSCNVTWLMTGSGSGPSLAKPSFYSSEPSDITWNEEEAIFREIAFFKEINSHAIVVMVKDRGMEPYYEQNGYVAGNKVSNNMISNLLGLNCIVETLRGDVLVRRLQKGSQDGRYTLVCLNPVQEIQEVIINDVELVNAAEIVWYRKRSSGEK